MNGPVIRHHVGSATALAVAVVIILAVWIAYEYAAPRIGRRRGGRR